MSGSDKHRDDDSIRMPLLPSAPISTPAATTMVQYFALVTRVEAKVEQRVWKREKEG